MTDHMKIQQAMIDAAEDFAAEDFGAQFYDEDERQIPRAFYVQKSSDGTWAAAFRPQDDMDAEMTRWATGDDAAALFNIALNASVNVEKLANASAEIVNGWDEDWTD